MPRFPGHQDQYPGRGDPARIGNCPMEPTGTPGAGHEPGSVRFEEAGLDYRVAFAVRLGTGERWVLRIPRRPDVSAKVAQERAILDLVRPRLSVRVPDWRIHAPGRPPGGGPGSTTTTCGRPGPSARTVSCIRPTCCSTRRTGSCRSWTGPRRESATRPWTSRRTTGSPRRRPSPRPSAPYQDITGCSEPRLARRCEALAAAAPLGYALFALDSGTPEHRSAAAAQLRR